MRNEDRAAKLVEALDPTWSPADVEERLDALQREGRRRKVRRRVVAPLAAAAAAAALFAFMRDDGVSVGPIHQPLVLADASSVTPSPEAQVIIDEVSDERVQVTLRDGGVDVEVTPNPEREFVVVCGDVEVVVLGTRFQVEKMADERARVTVERGHVRVRWPSGTGMETAELRTGRSGVFPLLDGHMDDPAPAESASNRGVPQEEDEAQEPTDEVSAGTAMNTRRRRNWRDVARRGEYDEAYSILEAAGADAVRDRVDDLLLAADAARLSGHGERALRYLRRVTQSHANDPRAPMAAFTQGRLLLSRQRHGPAAAAFEQTLSLGADGSLQENALARAVEAHSRGGNGERARTLAQRYLRRYPQGRWVSSVESFGLRE